MHPDRTQHHVDSARTAAAKTTDAHEHRTARTKRSRRARGAESDSDAWVNSREGRAAHERAAQELASARVQHLDHPAFLEAFDLEWIPASIEWTVTDEFTRRYGRLRARSQRAVTAALTAFVGDLARLAPHGVPRGRTGMQLRPLPPDAPVPGAWTLSWSSAGRATFLLEWRATEGRPVAHVTWLTIGPHGAPDRRRWRGNA